jgi:hypothetical protein
MTTNNVEITVSDGQGSVVVVPSQKVQVVIGVASGGTASINQVCSSTQPSTLQTLHGYGPLPEAAAISALSGGVILSVQIPIAATGTAKAVQHTGTGTSVVTVTLDGTVGAYDDYYVVLRPSVGGTIGTTGMTFQFSLDAGRTYTPAIALGTAVTYAIPNTGITLNFAAGTLVAADTYKFQTIAPAWNAAGVTAAIAALQASQYAIQGWGSMQLVGVAAAADVSTFETNLDTAATTYDVFTRMLASARDLAAGSAWGGAGETEATWMTSIETAFSAVSARREGVGAGYYNIPSAYPSLGTTFRYRRPGMWAVAARVVTIPTQRMASRVSDGQLTQIVVDPTSDPQDGFVYHDERTVPGLTGTRFQAFRTRIGKGQGFFLDLPNLMSPVGSDFQFFPQGSVIDIACDITRQVAQDEIDNDLILNANGTIAESEALRIESAIQNRLKENMTDVRMVSSTAVVVSRSQNVRTTGKVVITVTVNGVAYVLEVDATVGFQH